MIVGGLVSDVDTRSREARYYSKSDVTCCWALIRITIHHELTHIQYLDAIGPVPRPWLMSSAWFGLYY